MLIGYARISTLEQNLDLQIDALKKDGCEKIYSDTISGSKAKRPGLDECLEYVRSGDTIVVWKLDRLGRNLKHLIETVQALEDRGVGFKSLQENIDTTTPGGKLIFHVFGALAEFERDLIRERTLAGLAAARARGRIGGRKPALDKRKREVALALYRDKGVSIAEICRTLKISRTTFYRSIPVKRTQLVTPTEKPQPDSGEKASAPPSSSVPPPVVTPSPPVAVTAASQGEQGSVATPLSKPDLATQQLHAAQRLLALGPTPRERAMWEFQEALRELRPCIPVFSSGGEYIEWAQRVVEQANKRGKS